MSVDDKEDIIHTETAQEGKPYIDSIKNDATDEIVINADKRRAEERRLVRKLDMRVLPMIILIYGINYIDVRPPTPSILFEGLKPCLENGNNYREASRPGARPWLIG